MITYHAKIEEQLYPRQRVLTVIAGNGGGLMAGIAKVSVEECPVDLLTEVVLHSEAPGHLEYQRLCRLALEDLLGSCQKVAAMIPEVEALLGKEAVA